jgi:hypothetical protein
VITRKLAIALYEVNNLFRRRILHVLILISIGRWKILGQEGSGRSFLSQTSTAHAAKFLRGRALSTARVTANDHRLNLWCQGGSRSLVSGWR